MDSPIKYLKEFAMCISGEVLTGRHVLLRWSHFVTPLNLCTRTEVRTKYETSS